MSVWDLDHGTLLYSLDRTAGSHTGRVNAIALAHDGRHAISASADGTLKVWDLEHGQCLETFTAEHALRCCAISPDDRKVVAGDEMGSLLIFDLGSPEA